MPKQRNTTRRNKKKEQGWEGVLRENLAKMEAGFDQEARTYRDESRPWAYIVKHLIALEPALGGFLAEGQKAYIESLKFGEPWTGDADHRRLERMRAEWREMAKKWKPREKPKKRKKKKKRWGIGIKWAQKGCA